MQRGRFAGSTASVGTPLATHAHVNRYDLRDMLVVPDPGLFTPRDLCCRPPLSNVCLDGPSEREAERVKAIGGTFSLCPHPVPHPLLIQHRQQVLAGFQVRDGADHRPGIVRIAGLEPFLVEKQLAATGVGCSIGQDVFPLRTFEVWGVSDRLHRAAVLDRWQRDVVLGDQRLGHGAGGGGLVSKTGAGGKRVQLHHPLHQGTHCRISASSISAAPLLLPCGRCSLASHAATNAMTACRADWSSSSAKAPITTVATEIICGFCADTAIISALVVDR